MPYMRSRPLVLFLAAIVLARTSHAQDAGGQSAQGLQPGSYVRVSGGAAMPIAAQGSLRDWDSGSGFAVAWESWPAGPRGVGLAGFAITGAYNLLPFDEQRFISVFKDPVTGQVAQSVSASRAGILEITTNVKIRIPSPLVTPMVNIGLGLLDWHPGTIRYTVGNSTGTTHQEHRTGFEFTVGGGIDRTIVDRFGVFGEAMYVFGYTSYGGGYTSPGGVCSSNNCDALRNTTLGTIRGGLRVRVGR